jgi:hypothetical protein
MSTYKQNTQAPWLSPQANYIDTSTAETGEVSADVCG